MRIEVSEEIQASLETVFQRFTNFEQAQLIFHDAQEIRFVSEQKTGLGTEWIVVHEEKSSYRYRVVDFAPSSHFALDHEDRSATEKLSFRFEPSSSGTKVTYSVTMIPKGFFMRIFSILTKSLLRKMIRGDLVRLKDSIEDGTRELPKGD